VLPQDRLQHMRDGVRPPALCLVALPMKARSGTPEGIRHGAAVTAGG
jgi:hypothetical protein